MQTSKNHFEAKVVFNDETIRRMFRTEFYTYEGLRHLLWLAAAFVLVMAALFGMTGVWLAFAAAELITAAVMVFVIKQS